MNKKASKQCASGVPRVVPDSCGATKDSEKPIDSRTMICTHAGKPRIRGTVRL